MVIDARDHVRLTGMVADLAISHAVTAIPGEVADPSHRMLLAEAISDAGGLLPEPAARLVQSARKSGQRVIAVGTTVVRALETAARPNGSIRPASGWTDLVLGPDRAARKSPSSLLDYTPQRRATCCFSKPSPAPSSSAPLTPPRSNAATCGTSSENPPSSCLKNRRRLAEDERLRFMDEPVGIGLVLISMPHAEPARWNTRHPEEQRCDYNVST